jgi:hypothetical protein
LAKRMSFLKKLLTNQVLYSPMGNPKFNGLEFIWFFING